MILNFIFSLIGIAVVFIVFGGAYTMIINYKSDIIMFFGILIISGLLYCFYVAILVFWDVFEMSEKTRNIYTRFRLFFNKNYVPPEKKELE